MLLLIFLCIGLVESVVEIPLHRSRQLNGRITVTDLSGTVIRSEDTSTGVCLLTLDVRNCTGAHDNLGTTLDLGTPGQTFHVELQFGADTFWVVNSQCKKTKGMCGNRLPQHCFNSETSSTFESNGTVAILRFQGMKLIQKEAKDVISFGTQLHNQLLNQTTPTMMIPFGLVSRTPPSFELSAFDGQLGVGPSALPRSLLNSLLSSEADKVISVYVRNNGHSANETLRDVLHEADDGRILVGAKDRRFCDEDWTYAKLSGSGRWWNSAAKTVRLGKKTIGRANEVRFNPGSLLTFAPKWSAAELVEAIGAERFPGSNVYVVQTNDTSKLPILSFDFEDTTIQLTGDQYTAKLSVLPENSRMLTIHGLFETATWELGDDFHRAHCLLFDLAKRRVGFASPLREPRSLDNNRQQLLNSATSLWGMAANFWSVLILLRIFWE